MVVSKLSAVIALVVLALPSLASYGDPYGDDTTFSTWLPDTTTSSHKFTFFKNTRYPTNITVHFPTDVPPATLTTATSDSTSTSTSTSTSSKITSVVPPTNIAFPDDPKAPEPDCAKPGGDGTVYKTGNGLSYRAMCQRSYPGFLITTLWASSFGACAGACSREPKCMAFNLVLPPPPVPAAIPPTETGTGSGSAAKAYECELKSAIAATPDKVSTVWGATKMKPAVTVTLTTTTRMKRAVTVEARATNSPNWTGVGSQSEDLVGAEPTKVGGIQPRGNRLVTRVEARG